MAPAPIGNQNAKKQNRSYKTISFRCSLQEYERIIHLTRHRSGSLSWIIKWIIMGYLDERQLMVLESVRKRYANMKKAKKLKTHTEQEWEDLKLIKNYQCVQCYKK